MVRLRSAPVSQQPAPSKTATRPALKEKTNTTRTKAPVYEDDGDVEGLVKDARPRRGRAKKARQDSDELVMAGGLGLVDSDDKAVEPTEPPMTTDELSKSAAPPPPTAKAGRRPPRAVRKVVQNEAQSKVMDDVKRRMQATARKEATAKRTSAPTAPESVAPSSDSLPAKPTSARQSTNAAAERSEFSLSPSPPPPGKLNSVSKQRSSLAQPGSGLRPQSTPAVESSILALKNFKRRPRQPSMLQMVQQRTASARPSAAHVQATEDLDVSDLIGEEVDEEFAPDAEGTPLRARKSTRQPTQNGKQASKQTQSTGVKPPESFRPSNKRKSDDVDHSSSALDALRAKRQKSTGPDLEERLPVVPQTRATSRRLSSERQETPQPQLTSEILVINSSPSSTPPTEPSSSDRRRTSVDPDVAVPSTEKERDQIEYVPVNDLDNDQDAEVPTGTMAEPASSSPLPSDPIATQRTDVMAEPLTQLSPPRPPPEKQKKKAKQKPVTTATLQSMLPKRRQPPRPRHRKSEYDIESGSEDDSPLDSSLLGEDEDELGGKLRRQRKAAPTKGTKGANVKSKARQSKAASSTRKSSAAPHGRKSTAKKTGKTYGRATASDKENEEALDEPDDSVLPDTSITMHDAVQSKELEEAKKKFADVDEWDMEFESMSFEEHRSSSQQWR
ncbi:hypothetical protein LTR37_017753 [Vermiconidia calcicola]|uniref:Uncharacterized protein n=1 Tax=Vermiconidia calcicola TaxID=1690605 RepID=A0ACC3MJ24_9PEZI|nr:hypothetical protein LTR37_017753 [Vermiconidia calcicola]